MVCPACSDLRSPLCAGRRVIECRITHRRHPYLCQVCIGPAVDAVCNLVVLVLLQGLPGAMRAHAALHKGRHKCAKRLTTNFAVGHVQNDHA